MFLKYVIACDINYSVKRGRQRYIFPLLMSREIQPVATTYGLLLPVLAYAAVKALLVFPYLKKQKEL